jgi:hypothetical protein
MSSVIWNITPCGSLKISVFKEHGTSIFRVQEYNEQKINMVKAGRRAWLTFIGLHGAKPQKVQLFLTTMTRTSNPKIILSFHFELWCE